MFELPSFAKPPNLLRETVRYKRKAREASNAVLRGILNRVVDATWPETKQPEGPYSPFLGVKPVSDEAIRSELVSGQAIDEAAEFDVEK